MSDAQDINDTRGLLTETLRDSVMLVQFSARKWSGTANDQKAVEEMAQAAGAKRADVGRFAKNLLSGVDGALKNVHSAIDAGRNDHYRMTLPWSTATGDESRRGPRLLPNALFVVYMKRMQGHRMAVKEALDKFVEEYPTLKEQAAENLGGLYDERLYPKIEHIRMRFGFNFDFQPLPASTDFRGLPDNIILHLGHKMEEKAQSRVDAAMDEAWRRAYNTLERMVERLNVGEDKKPRFHASLIENVREVAYLLKHMNIRQDANLEAIRQDIEQSLTAHDAADLRKDQNLRKQVGGEAQRILTKMSGWYSPSEGSDDDEADAA